MLRQELRLVSLGVLLGALLVTSSRTAEGGINSWTSTGRLEGGPIGVLAIDPVTPATLYAGTGAGIFVYNGGSYPPPPAFTYSPSKPVAGSPVSFDASSSTCAASPCSYGWTDDADGSLLGTGIQMSFTFRDPGTKYVRLTITDAQSRTASVEHDVMVSHE